jgi:AraC-like DNA-binding protein
MVGFLIRAAGSLREAVQTLARYSPLLSESMAWQLQELGGTARLVLASTNVQRFDVELLFGLALRYGSELTAGLRAPAVSVELGYAAPEHVRAYHQTFPGQVRFGCSQHALVFARELLDAPRLTFMDTQTAARIREHAESLLLAKAQESIVERTRAFLLQEPDLSAFDAGRLARWIGLNERTLRRRLASAGMPLPVLLNEVRRSVALRDLRAPGVTIKQLSERLGFSEPSAFHRAFKRWTGKTPVEFMREPAPVDLSVRLEPVQNAFVDAGRKLQLKEVPGRQHALHH